MLFNISISLRYMFNVGEGTQRIAHEHRVKISRMEHLFITYPIWENMGGLPGLALTLQECGVPDLTVHGPKGLVRCLQHEYHCIIRVSINLNLYFQASLFEATRRFVVLNHLKVRSVVCAENQSYKDKTVTIEYVPLLSNNPTMHLDRYFVPRFLKKICYFISLFL